MKTKLLMLLACVALLAGCATRGFPPIGTIQNFDQVDAYLCRGAQENITGLKFLRSQGVTLVINLRDEGEAWDREADACRQLGMGYAWIPMHGLGKVNPIQVEKALVLIDIESRLGGKVFVHCQHGCDRTGTIVACYEIRHGVSNKAAQKEADLYGMSPFETGMHEFIKKFK